MRILLVAHGYPPRETAGTEQHSAALAEELQRRGHAVRVFAATRAPGRRQYSLLTEGPVTRVVQNLPGRPPAQCERDSAIDALFQQVQHDFRPDLVHVHHLQFLSSSLPVDAPMVLTLHDGWHWCAAGGLELLPDGAVCPGPRPERCAPCAAEWEPVPGRTARGLVRLAGSLAPLVAPKHLHALYRRLPGGLRARLHRGRPAPSSPDDIQSRNRAMASFARRAQRRVAPSRYLARRAEEMGLGPVQVVPHGVPHSAPLHRKSAQKLLFLGTIAHHKGPDLVVEAWRRACPDGRPELALHGPVVDPALLRDHPVGPVLNRGKVAEALADARALVMGSRWRENAPLVILEARAAGCPVVAPRIGGIPELVEDGRDGLLYRPNDAEDLARALRQLLDAPPMTPAPPRRFTEHVDEIETLYRELLS